MGEWMDYDGLPFLGTDCPVPGLGINYVVWNE